MTPRFRALIRISVLFACVGIPIGIASALWEAWRRAPTLGDGSHFWSLAAGFAVDQVRLFCVLFALIGVGFGLWLSFAGYPVGRPHSVRRAGWLGTLAGAIAGVAAYVLGGWGAGEPLTTWLAGAATLGALSAAIGGGFGAGFLAVAARSKLLPPEGTRALLNHSPPVAK